MPKSTTKKSQPAAASPPPPPPVAEPSLPAVTPPIKPKIVPMRELMARAEPVPLPARLENENDLWYSRFTRWLTMTKPRSVLSSYNAEKLDAWEMAKEAASRPAKVQRGARKPKPNRPMPDPAKPFVPATGIPGDWQEHTSLFRWRDRAAEYDRAVQASLEPVLLEIARVQTMRELESADALFQRALDLVSRDPVQIMRDEESGTVEFVAIQPGTYVAAAKLVESARIAVRSALGQPDSTAAVKHSGEISDPAMVNAAQAAAEAQQHISDTLRSAFRLRLAAVRSGTTMQLPAPSLSEPAETE